MRIRTKFEEKKLNERTTQNFELKKEIKFTNESKTKNKKNCGPNLKTNNKL